MKVMYRTKNGRMSFEIEGDKQQDVWEKIAALQEIFEETNCGKCASDDVRFVVRKAKNDKGKEFKYYELHCKKCRARLSFGVFEDASGIFPKRKDAEGNWVGNNGWKLFNKETGKEE